eukprot:g4005.t1
MDSSDTGGVSAELLTYINNEAPPKPHDITVYTNSGVCQYSPALLTELKGCLFNHVDVSQCKPPSWLPGTPTLVHKNNVYCGDAAFLFAQNFDCPRYEQSAPPPEEAVPTNPFSKKVREESRGCGLSQAFSPPPVIDVDETDEVTAQEHSPMELHEASSSDEEVETPFDDESGEESEDGSEDESEDESEDDSEDESDDDASTSSELSDSGKKGVDNAFEYAEVIDDASKAEPADAPHDEDLGGEVITAASAVAGVAAFSGMRSRRNLIVGVVLAALGAIALYYIWRKMQDMKNKISRLEKQQDMGLNDKDVQCISSQVLEDYLKQVEAEDDGDEANEPSDDGSDDATSSSLDTIPEGTSEDTPDPETPHAHSIEASVQEEGRAPCVGDGDDSRRADDTQEVQQPIDVPGADDAAAEPQPEQPQLESAIVDSVVSSAAEGSVFDVSAGDATPEPSQADCDTVVDEPRRRSDLAGYGDVKGRDTYSRNSFHSVKGDGVSLNTITEGFYGIPSAADVEVELARLTVAEGAVDNGVAAISYSANDGASLNTVCTMSNSLSEIASTTINLTSTDVVASGNLNVGTLQKNDLASGARVELVDDATDPAINFVLGDLDTTPTTPLIVTKDVVAVTGSLTLDGVDLASVIESGALWEVSDGKAKLKDAYPVAEVNIANAYTTAVALDVNGSQRLRGNDLLFYDEPLDAFYSALTYIESAGQVRLRASRAGDAVVVATSTGVNNTYLDRLTFDDGSGTQSATFTNVNVGIGAAPSGANALEVTGSVLLTAGLTTGGNVDIAGNQVLNVSRLDSSDLLAEQARITLTSDATDASMDVIIGDLAATPTTVATFTDTAAAINVPTTIDSNLIVTGDIQIQGAQTTINTETLTVEDVNVDLGNTATAHADIDGGGITLGVGVVGITTPTIAYSVTNTRWESTIGLHVDTGEAVTVGATATLDESSLDLRTDTGYIYIGATQQWRLGIYNDGTDDHFSIDHFESGVYVSKLDVME